MNNLFISFCCLLSVSIMSCSGKDGKKVTDLHSVSNLKDYADKINEGTEVANARRAQRVKRGDTMAMPYKDLQAFLPDVNGYIKKGGPSGSQSNSPMGSFSKAEQKFISGVNTVTISIVDYNSAHQAFMGLTAVYGMGFSFEDDNKKQAPVDLGKEGIAAYETIYKDGKRGDLIMIVADRFIININAKGEASEDFLKSIATDMEIKELAKR